MRASNWEYSENNDEISRETPTDVELCGRNIENYKRFFCSKFLHCFPAATSDKWKNRKLIWMLEYAIAVVIIGISIADVPKNSIGKFNINGVSIIPSPWLWNFTENREKVELQLSCSRIMTSIKWFFSHIIFIFHVNYSNQSNTIDKICHEETIKVLHESNDIRGLSHAKVTLPMSFSYWIFDIAQLWNKRILTHDIW